VVLYFTSSYVSGERTVRKLSSCLLKKVCFLKYEFRVLSQGLGRVLVPLDHVLACACNMAAEDDTSDLPGRYGMQLWQSLVDRRECTPAEKRRETDE
jgi:hypothetical protein